MNEPFYLTPDEIETMMLSNPRYPDADDRERYNNELFHAEDRVLDDLAEKKHEAMAFVIERITESVLLEKMLIRYAKGGYGPGDPTALNDDAKDLIQDAITELAKHRIEND